MSLRLSLLYHLQIPAENLPHALGGECNCPGGGCSLSDAGPWNTDEGRKIVGDIREEQKRKRELHEKGGAPNGTK
jgi:hypothetical protein